MPTQNISVTDELAAFVSDQIKTGDYASVSEVYREALRRFRDQEEDRRTYHEVIRQKLEISRKAYQRGEYVTLKSDEEIHDFVEKIGTEIEHA